MNILENREQMNSFLDLEAVLEESALSLPTLPNVFVAVLEQLTSKQASASDVALIVGKDQSLTSRLLAIANSPAYGFRNEVSTIARAVALLGFDVVRNLALSVSVFDDFLDRKEIVCFDKTQFWEHSLVCAAVAKEIARQMRVPSADELYVAGLLHDVGKVALDSAARRPYHDLLAEASRDGVGSLALEQKRLGTDHAHIAGMLCEKWTLPKDIAYSIRYHHEVPEEGLTPRQELMTAVVAVADFICWTQGFGSIDALHPPYLSERAQELVEMERLDIGRICDCMDRQIISTAELFSLSVPSAQKFRDALRKANVELGRINSLYEEARRQLQHQVQELSCLNRALYMIGQDLNVGATIRALLRAIRDELGFSKILFFTADNKDGKLRLSDHLVEEDSDGNNSKYDLLLEDHNIFSGFLKESRVTRIRREPGQEEAPILASLDTDEIFVIPVPSKHGLGGIITADNGYHKRRSGMVSIESLNILAHEAGLAIDNALLFERTKELATKDDLTQLFNRRHCSNLLRIEMERSKRYRRPLSVAMFDIDHFKIFNDRFGHQAGDKILKGVAQLILSCSRSTDVVGRYGGEEFIAILPETTTDGARDYCECIRVAIERFGKVKREEFASAGLTISGGAASFDSDDDTFDTFLNRADQALYKAKQEGRNKIVLL